MFSSLSRAVASRRHIVNAISPSTLQDLLSVQTQWLSLRYSTSIPSNRPSFTVSYLVDTFGFSFDDATSISKYVNLETREKPDLVVSFLKNQGFSHAQIVRFIREVPVCLRFDPVKTFLPKIEFFKSKGVSSSDIPKVISSCPNIMKRSLSKQIEPSFDFFRNLVKSDDMFVNIVKEYSGILLDINTHAVPNLKVLREVGVPESNIIKLLKTFPRALTKVPPRFKEIVEEVKKLGFHPSSTLFVWAVYTLTSLSKSTWAKKSEAYKKWGWSDNDILLAVRRFPFCMKISEDKIDVTMEFLVNNMGCESSAVLRYPQILSLSLNKRIVPRASVFQVLLSKGLVKQKSSLAIFVYTETIFMNRANEE
ncbi:transcription termination factor MTERF8, chloroplastic-like [Senna tora]|uniref:Transcription termination factor MTERF8, chloroplastic-like n=1 Tax=Senna tora TaxID=362788 RepID=A0A834X2X5_9FABA|nr:transcription termination factor MTERF8, chloroplastic-like [Senna tora]